MDEANAAAERIKADLPAIAERVEAIHERVDRQPEMRSPAGDAEKALHAFDPIAFAATLGRALAPAE